METTMKPPKGYCYVPVREYLKVDLPGSIAIPIDEAIAWYMETDNAKTGK